jgi:hypothetical protein
MKVPGIANQTSYINVEVRFGYIFNLCIFTLYYFIRGSRGSSVGIATVVGLEGRCLISTIGKRFLSAPQRPYWL